MKPAPRSPANSRGRDQKNGCQYEASDGVDGEERAVGWYMSVSLRPQVEMDGGHPYEESGTGQAEQDHTEVDGVVDGSVPGSRLRPGR